MRVLFIKLSRQLIVYIWFFFPCRTFMMIVMTTVCNFQTTSTELGGLEEIAASKTKIYHLVTKLITSGVCLLIINLFTKSHKPQT